MNILFLINEFERGGAERVVSYLLHHLPEIDPDLKLSLFILEKSEFAYPVPEYINIYTGSKYHSLNLLKFLKLPLLALRLRKLVIKESFQIVISFLNRANYVNIISTYLNSGHRCIISERNTPSQTYITRKIIDVINKRLIRWLYPASHLIISVSEGVKEDLVKKFNISEQLIKTIYNPYDIRMIEEKSKATIQHRWFGNRSYKIILTVGRLEKQKNHALLIRAFQRVQKKVPDSRLLIIGEGTLRKNLSNLIKDLKLQSKVLLLGEQENPFSYMANSDLFVLSSDFEGFPNTLVEAMICGCPVLSTECKSGPNEIINNGVNGYLVPVMDRDSLYNGMVELLQNNPVRQYIKDNAFKTVNKFSIESITRKYLQIITQEQNNNPFENR